MQYTELAKLYYGDKEVYKQTYMQRFSANTSVKLDFDINGYQAFFVQSEEVAQLMYKILRHDKEISLLCKSLPGVALKQYTRQCLIDEIVLTNNIEGVHSSRKEIGDALKTLEEQSNSRGKKSVFLGLVNKYLKLMSGENVSLNTCKDIRDIYDELVLEEVISEDPSNAPDGKLFRKEITEVHNEADKVIHKGKYPESEIVIYMEKALSFLNNGKLEPLYRACIFHYMLEYIHPFYDGNGRLGRFILSCCISENLEYLLAFRISQTIKENISKYYSAFKMCNDHRNLADLTPFLIMMLEMIEKAADKLKDSLSKKLISWDHYKKIIPQLDGAKSEQMVCLYDVLIQAALFSELGISSQGLLAGLATTYSTLEKKLKIVDNQNLLLFEKHGNRKYYMVNLKVLDDILMES